MAKKNWVQCSDRMPVVGVPVVVCTKTGGNIVLGVAWLDENGDWRDRFSEKVTDQVFGWFAIPEID